MRLYDMHTKVKYRLNIRKNGGFAATLTLLKQENIPVDCRVKLVISDSSGSAPTLTLIKQQKGWLLFDNSRVWTRHDFANSKLKRHLIPVSEDLTPVEVNNAHMDALEADEKAAREWLIANKVIDLYEHAINREDDHARYTLRARMHGHEDHYWNIGAFVWERLVEA